MFVFAASVLLYKYQVSEFEHTKKDIFNRSKQTKIHVIVVTDMNAATSLGEFCFSKSAMTDGKCTVILTLISCTEMWTRNSILSELNYNHSHGG